MGVEYEQKFRATPQIQQQLEARWADCFRSIQMETTYYDTPNGDFSALRCTLRCRRENEKTVCTLKTPGEDNTRGEWELERASIADAVGELCKLSGWEVLRPLAQMPLQPVCGARFLRKAASITLPLSTLELALDTGVLMGGGKEIPLCEIEVEHLSGDRRMTDRFAAELKAEFALEPEAASKFARAKALL